MNWEKVKDLILLLMYETSWTEEVFDQSMVSSWKGYPFEALNELEEEVMLYQTRRSKKVRLSEAGIEKAKKIQQMFESVDWE